MFKCLLLTIGRVHPIKPRACRRSGLSAGGRQGTIDDSRKGAGTNGRREVGDGFKVQRLST